MSQDAGTKKGHSELQKMKHLAVKQVSQGGSELLTFKGQEEGAWIGALLPEVPSRPGDPRPIVLETGGKKNHIPPPRKDTAPCSAQTGGQTARRLSRLLS